MSLVQSQGYADDGNYDLPYLIRIRGLPWSTTKQDILNFFDGVHILNGEDGIHLVTLALLPNRPLGEAFIQLATQKDLNLAHTYDRKNLGTRYIEVFDAHVEDFQNIISKQYNADEDRVIRLRGLPWNATKLDIADFFQGLELNAETDIHIHYDKEGRASGEAYVQFRSIDDCQDAMKRNMEKLGHRYIEIFSSTQQELRRSVMQTNQVQGLIRFRNRNGNQNNGNDNGGNFGPMRDKRNNRNNVRKPYTNNESGYRNQSDQNTNNNNRFNNGNHFDDRRSNGNGNDEFRNYNNNSGSYRNLKSNDKFENRNGNYRFNCSLPRNLFGANNLNDFQSGYGQSDGGIAFNRDYGKANRFNSNSDAMQRSTFDRTAFGGSRNLMSNSRTENLVFVRGMPFYCDEMDIYKFFAPIKPIYCNIILNEKERHTGRAEVTFNSREDVVHAMQRDRQKMGSRYIELFDANDKRCPRF